MGDPSAIYIDGKLVPLHQILDFLEENDDAIPDTGVNITLLPPTNATNDLTDEDSGDEEEPNIDNFPASQLHAPAIINILSDSAETDEDNMRPTTSSEVTHKGIKRKLTQNEGMRKRKYKKEIKPVYEWSKDEEISSVNSEWPLLYGPKNKMTPLEYFELFFDSDVYAMMLEHTNNYARTKNTVGDISLQEMKCFVAVLLMSGYNTVSRKVMYWEQLPDCHNSLIANAISRDRFKYIMANIHVCDNLNISNKNDRFAKIRPLLVEINKRCQLFAPHEQHHSVDESMVPYFGRHGTKQFIRGKPIRYGFKFWCGGPSSGYLSWLEPYQGKGTLQEKYSNKGLGYGVVMTYADQLCEFPYKIFFDNFFTSCELLSDLQKRAIGVTGTVRTNRLGKFCPLRDPSNLKGSPRGSYVYCSDVANNIMILSWNDNNIVTFGTNYDSLLPIHQVSRFSQEKKKKIKVDQPHLIHNYNKKMGGIDRADQNISLYRVSIRGKKWYFPLIAHLIDVAEQNAWQLQKQDGGKLDHLMFRRRIATAILESNQKMVTAKGRPSSIDKIDSRYDKLEHYVGELEVDQATGKKKQLHCRLCRKKATTKCLKCDVALHVSCFLSYHTK